MLINSAVIYVENSDNRGIILLATILLLDLCHYTELVSNHLHKDQRPSVVVEC